jgi:flagellar biosynthesis protein FliR
MIDVADLALPARVAGLMLVLARVTSFIVTAPVLSARFVPMRVRLMLGLVLGASAWWSTGAAAVDDVTPMMVVAEVTMGLLMGAAARAGLEAAFSAGSLFSGQVGLSFAQTVDPLSGTQSDVGSDLLSMLALMMAVALGLHREAIVVICGSVIHVPPGHTPELSLLLEQMLPSLVDACALAVRLAFPMMAMTSAGYVLMGVMARGSPALGLQGLGFTVPVLAGGFALYSMAPVVAEMAARASIATLHSFR